jgi:hypothetical protein
MKDYGSVSIFLTLRLISRNAERRLAGETSVRTAQRALDTGTLWAMANKKNFAPQEWLKVLESVMLTGMAVSAADPNGLRSITKEAFANRSALIASKLDSGSNDAAAFKPCCSALARKWQRPPWSIPSSALGACW